MLFQSCQTATKSFLLQNSLMGVGIRPAPTKKQRKRIATPVTSVTGSQSANYLLIVKTSQQQRRQISKRFPRATPTSWQNLRIYLIRASSRRKNLTRRKSSCWDCKKLSAGSKSLPAIFIPPPAWRVDPPWFSRSRTASQSGLPGSPAAGPPRENIRLRRRGGACPRPFCRTQVFVGGRFVNRPYGETPVWAVGARPWAPRRPNSASLDPFRHGCAALAATPPPEGEARAGDQRSPLRGDGGLRRRSPAMGSSAARLRVSRPLPSRHGRPKVAPTPSS